MVSVPIVIPKFDGSQCPAFPRTAINAKSVVLEPELKSEPVDSPVSKIGSPTMENDVEFVGIFGIMETVVAGLNIFAAAPNQES